jgi:hypothetical protein
LSVTTCHYAVLLGLQSGPSEQELPVNVCFHTFAGKVTPCPLLWLMEQYLLAESCQSTVQAAIGSAEELASPIRKRCKLCTSTGHQCVVVVIHARTLQSCDHHIIWNCFGDITIPNTSGNIWSCRILRIHFLWTAPLLCRNDIERVILFARSRACRSACVPLYAAVCPRFGCLFCMP